MDGLLDFYPFLFYGGGAVELGDNFVGDDRELYAVDEVG